jgi:outer membrane protein insertion porin family
LKLLSQKNLFSRFIVLIALMPAFAFVDVCAPRLMSSRAMAEGEVIDDIVVRGNGRVESDAILTIINSKRGDKISNAVVRQDMTTLFQLGYFSDLRFFKSVTPKGVTLVIQVAEKPAITSITFEGMSEVKEDDVKEKIETKNYAIVNEEKLTSDLKAIEKVYAEKGFYLSRVTYQLEKSGPNDVALKYVVSEGGVLQVADVTINGNKYFTDAALIQKMASQPFTRSSAYGSSALYKDDFIKNDLGYLNWIYRDNGFAEVQVAKPIQVIDPDRNFVRITYKLEEGIQYNVGTIDFSGDLLFTKDELQKKMKLKPGKLFRYSQFTGDIEMLNDKYGDLGYAYADINPIVTYDKEKKLANINFEIAKGEKIYFGDMTIIGNTKTRDNVLRRDFQIADAELYQSTGLGKTKAELSRLGFFEDVQVLKERNTKDETILDLKYKIKEKPTGQLQASIGYTPPQGGGSKSGVFGQGAYDEQNQSGFGYKTGLHGKWDGNKNYSLDLGFTNPRVNDSFWSAGTNLDYSHAIEDVITDVTSEVKKYGASVFVGRKIIEEIIGRVTYQLQKTEQKTSQYLLDKFEMGGLQSSVIFSVFRNATNDNIAPSEGTEVSLRHKITGGPVLRGDYKFQESSLDASVYLPIDFSDTFRTYFKLSGSLSYIYSYLGSQVPFAERYKLGGYNDMRGYDFSSIGPKFYMLRAPGYEPKEYNRGGDKKLLFQFEYFVPLIQEAGIKALGFMDMGRVYDDNESISLKGMSKDVGFGFRWQTPIAPFRFEWAYPLENGQLGEPRPIFSIGF